jgi:hypothetical protein
MSSSAATILAAAISAAISFAIAGASYISAKNGARGAVQAKRHELTQVQIAEYSTREWNAPLLWELCQKGISIPYLTGSLLGTGWEADLSNTLESWHAKHGVFLSEDCYRGLWHLRKLARIFSTEPAAEDASLSRLRALDAIWSHEFTDNDGTDSPGLSVLLKNDLGSYGKAALSISDGMSKRIGTTSDGLPADKPLHQAVEGTEPSGQAPHLRHLSGRPVKKLVRIFPATAPLRSGRVLTIIGTRDRHQRTLSCPRLIHRPVSVH